MNNAPKVLFVDDEPMILKSIERLVREEPYEVFFASGGTEALQLIATVDIDIVVSDYDMPAIDGLELFERLRQEDGDIVRIMMTGRLAMTAWENGIDNGSVQRFIQKPWRNDAFLRALAEAADAVHARRGQSLPDMSDTRRFRRTLSIT